MLIEEITKLKEDSDKTAVIAFGRFNPPTIGHKKLADKIASIPGDHFIFLSHSSGGKTKKPGTKGYENKDPLPFDLKLKYAKASFPNVNVGDGEVKTVIQAMQKINSMGYNKVVYVAGSDRVEEMTDTLNRYNGSDYNFDSLEIVSAGERDPDSDDVDGMSASKMRAAVRQGDFEKFSSGVANSSIAKEMFVVITKILKQNPMDGDNFMEIK